MAAKKTNPTEPAPAASRRSAPAGRKPRPGADGAVPSVAVKPERAGPAAGVAAGKARAGSARLRMKLVRDSFTMPESDFALINELKKTAIGAKREAKKSELLRAGLRALAALEAKALVTALDRLEPVKVGRPKKGH